ncbi:MAG: ATP-binding protein [Myxococcota bacterium]
MRLLPVRDWPLSLKLATTVLLVAVIPLLLVALVNEQQVASHSHSRETQSLERRAAAAARRLEERVGRLRAYAELVAENPTIVAAVRDGSGTASSDQAQRREAARAWDRRHPEIYALLTSLRRANAWFANVYLLDPGGICLATSEREYKPTMIGRPYDYRPYFQAAMGDRAPFVTDVLKNATSAGTGIFVSAPVRVDEAVAGVVVLKVDAAALHEVVADLARTGGSALLVDRFGVVVSDAWTGALRGVDDPSSLQFHPLASLARFFTLFEQTQRYGNPQGEHYLDRVRQPLALDSLWNSLQQRRSGAAEHGFPAAFGAAAVPTMVGYAPVTTGHQEPYGYILLGEVAAEFRGPLAEIAQAALWRAGLVALGVALVIALLIRRFARQVVDLTQGARRLAAGQRAGSLLLPRGDELGMLAQSIQRLADHVHETVTAQKEARTHSERARDAAEAVAQARTDAVGRAHAVLEAAQRSLRELPPGGERGGGRKIAATIDGCRLDLAALGSENAALVPSVRRVDVEALVREVIEPYVGEVPERAVRVEVGSNSEIPPVQTDRGMLRRLLHHLVDNACKFTRQGEVVVRLSAVDDGVKIEVRDTGIGLTARQAGRITSEGDEPIGEGGIGLWVVRRLARVLGVRLSAQGEVGRGSVVVVVVEHPRLSATEKLG